MGLNPLVQRVFKGLFDRNKTSVRRRNQSHPLARDDGAVNNDGHKRRTKTGFITVENYGIVVRMPSKSFSAARKNRRLQNLSHRSCALSGCCPPTPPQSSVFPAGRIHRPARPLTLHRPHTVDSNGRRRPALAPAPCTSTIDLVGTAFVVSPARTPSSLRSRTRARLKAFVPKYQSS